MKNLHLFLSMLLFATLQGFAQNTSLTFHTETYNFGRILKTQTPIRYNFIFQNTSTMPIVLQDVISDCACVTSSFPKHPIQPNKEGIISVTFSPYRASPSVNYGA